MPPPFTYPGVYVSERESGARAVPAAATSIAMFIGMAASGPIGVPRRIQSLDAFQRTYGETSPGELALQVQQFFINGGGDSYVMRIANGAERARIDINDATTASNPTLRLIATDHGAAGNQIRAEIDYAAANPEGQFNLTVFRSVPNGSGGYNREDAQTFSNLSMNPVDPRFVETVVNAAGGLVEAESLATAPGAADTGGVSVSGLFFENDEANTLASIANLVDASHRAFRIKVGANPMVTAVIDLGIDGSGTITEPATGGNLVGKITGAINQAYDDIDITGLAITVRAAVSTSSQPRVLEIRSDVGSVTIQSAASNDLAQLLQLGIANGGIEFDAYSPLRPAPTGLSGSSVGGTGRPTTSWLSDFMALANADRNTLGDLVLTDGSDPSSPYSVTAAITGTQTEPLREDPALAIAGASGTITAARAGLAQLATQLSSLLTSRWNAAQVGAGIHLTSKTGFGDAGGLGAQLTSTGATNIGDAGEMFAAAANIAAYTLGTATIGGLQGNAILGDDGTTPGLGDYTNAFDAIRESVEIFNIMALPRAHGQSDTDRQALWGAASSFCAEQRAFLLVDPYASWSGIDDAEAGANTIKLGVDTRHAASYWPRILVPTAANTAGEAADPCGSMAGLYARTDTRFGTWRAPAGIQATLTGVVGVEHPMGDMANGRINPRALNAIRQFPSGITSWGARTMVGADDTGNIDDKYINVRRMMLFIENSLYRGLRFAVFRNNAEPLWAQIRLAAGSFMNSLMLQGAFASQTKDTAYFVQCDQSTTTPTDVNLGIVNVVVGFAPNKPAEFVHLTVTQIAGQTEV